MTVLIILSSSEFQPFFSFFSFFKKIVSLKGTELLEELAAKVKRLEERGSIIQDERLSLFSKAMGRSSGKHSVASRFIDETYGHRCLFCGETNDVTKAHIVAANKNADYSVFCKPLYRDDLDVKSPRNFIPLCGTDGKEGTCHNEFDKYLMTLIYNPFEGKFAVRCLRESFPKFQLCDGRVVHVDANLPPYRRLLAWRTRKCIMEHQYLIRGQVSEWIQLCNFSEDSHSIADAADANAETESISKESEL